MEEPSMTLHSGGPSLLIHSFLQFLQSNNTSKCYGLNDRGFKS